MTKNDEREVQRKLRVLQHAERLGLMSTLKPSSTNGRTSTTSSGHMELSKEKRLTKLFGKGGLVPVLRRSLESLTLDQGDRQAQARRGAYCANQRAVAAACGNGFGNNSGLTANHPKTVIRLDGGQR